MSKEFTCWLFRLKNTKSPILRFHLRALLFSRNLSGSSVKNSSKLIIANKAINSVKNELFKDLFTKRRNKIDPSAEPVYDKLTLAKMMRNESEINENFPGSGNGTVVRQLKVMNYNVLAQDLVEQHRYLYRNHSPEYLVWDHRYMVLKQQILTFLPDILTLQEVQESHIGPYYSQLEKFGYKGIFKRRTGTKGDGCAIYYMSSLLELVDYQTVEYYRPHIAPTILNRPNVAIIARLRSKSSEQKIIGREVIVANTHLLYNPRRSDVRLAQIQILLAEIEKIAKKVEHPAVLLVGDLNSLPNSPVVRLLAEGKIPSYFNSLPVESGITNKCCYRDGFDESVKKEEKIVEKNEINGEACRETENLADRFKKVVGCSELEITHNFKFKSVYDWKDYYNRYLATTFQDQWVIVDYMFHSNNMKMVSRLQLPTVQQCDYEIGCIPNSLYPSDHFPLAANFAVE